jgi:phosphate:Na+ symporter
MEPSLDHYLLLTGLLGGLALFLFGMDIMTDSLKRAAGGYLKDILAGLTKNRFMGVGIGALVTAVVNSSSVTTVILVGFISAGLLSMAQSVSVIMGANIGSTITAQILAFKVSQIALPAITVGFAISFLASKEQVKQIGRMLLGFGLVFYGMSVMSDAMSPLRTNQEFRDVLASLDTAIAAAAAGAVFTAVIQSSAATTGIVIVMAGQGLVSLDAAIAISLGANIGTCATAGLAAIGKPREAVRAAVVHFIFNVVGVLVWIGFIPEFAEMVRAISPSSEDLSGAARVAAEAPRQIANAHTIFNVANTALFIGFTTQFARLVEWLVPDKPLKPDEAATPKFLDPDLLDTPAVALDNVRFELDRLGDQVVEMLDDAFNAGTHPQAAGMDEVVARDKAVDSLHRAIIAYLGRISTSGLSEEEGRDVLRLLEVANGLEYIGDRVATDIAGSARKRVDEGGKIDPKRAARIRKVHADVVRALADAISAVANEDPVLATDVRQRKVGLNRMRIEIEASSVELLKGDKGGIGLYIREIELLEILNAIFRAARAIARTQIPVKEAEQALSAAT